MALKDKRHKAITSRYKELSEKYSDKSRIKKQIQEELNVSRTTIWRVLKK